MNGDIIQRGDLQRLSEETDEGLVLTLTLEIPPGTKRREVLAAAEEKIRDLLQVSGRPDLTLKDAREIEYYFENGFTASYLAKSYGVPVKKIVELMSGENEKWPWIGAGCWWEGSVQSPIQKKRAE